MYIKILIKYSETGNEIITGAYINEPKISFIKIG